MRKKNMFWKKAGQVLFSCFLTSEISLQSTRFFLSSKSDQSHDIHFSYGPVKYAIKTFSEKFCLGFVLQNASMVELLLKV